MKVLKKNKKALYDYEAQKRIEAGIVLHGWEAKSLKNGAGHFEGSYIVVHGEEAFLKNFSIKPWRYSPDVAEQIQKRDKKLLLHKAQIKSLEASRKADRYTLIPLDVYENDKGVIKVSIALAKSKRKFDKRNKLKQKD